jgi:isopenicillin N synthase-like dioxygenase
MRDEQNDIPIIDFTPWASANGSEDDKSKISNDIFDAFSTIGFIILVHHGVQGDSAGSQNGGVTSRTFQAAKEFFALPTEIKKQSAYVDPASNRGYISMGQEKLDGQLPDLKETFDIGYEGEKDYGNQWPTGMKNAEDFKQCMLDYFDEYDQLHLNIFRALARGMGLENDDYFTPLCNGNHQNLRLLHYPECDRATITGGQKRGGIHTDYGTLTLLSQQDVSGLIAQRLDGTWVSVPPIPGGIVVNVGQMLQRWSNDMLRATPHQVLDTFDEKNSERVAERYSIAFFCNANKETSLECLPACQGPDRPPKYEVVNAFDYITARLTETIPLEQ